MRQWEMVKLGDVCKFINGDRGKNYPSGKDFVDSGIPFINAGHLENNVVSFSNMNYIEEYKYNQLGSGKIQRGDFLYCLRGSLGKHAIIDNFEQGAVASSLVIIRPENIDIHYLSYCMDSSNILEQQRKANNGSSQPNLSATSVKQFVIPLPPIEIQQKIAKTLDTAAALLKLRKQQLAELDQLIQSVFYDMFGDPVRNEKGWHSMHLGELCTIVRGGSPRPIVNFLGGTIPWIKIGDATKGDEVYLRTTKEHIIEEGIKKSRHIKKGSLIFANCGVSLGFARIITFDGCIHDGWLAFQDIDERLDKIFLLKSLNMCTDYFRRIAPDGTQPNLNTEIMKKFMQFIPPKSAQEKFVNEINQITELKFIVQKSVDELDTLFNGLMQKYFG